MRKISIVPFCLLLTAQIIKIIVHIILKVMDYITARSFCSVNLFFFSLFNTLSLFYTFKM